MRLILGDSLAVLPTLESASVDCVIADPPYGATQCPWDSVIPLKALWAELERVTRPGAAIVMTASQPFASSLVVCARDWFRYEWIWDKANPSGHLNAPRRPLSRHESVLVFSQGRHTYNPQMRCGKWRQKGTRSQASECYGEQAGSVKFNDQYYPTSILEFSNADKAGREHSTQKPVPLMAYLVRTYTDEGETVLDFCMGSGTTGVACAIEQRSFIGIEKDPAYFAIAERRIAEAQGPLFARKVAR